MTRRTAREAARDGEKGIFSPGAVQAAGMLTSQTAAPRGEIEPDDVGAEMTGTRTRTRAEAEAGGNVSTLIDVANLEVAKAETEPFPFLVVEKFLHPSGLGSLVADFPAVSEPRNHSLEGLEYGPYFAKLLDEFARPEWIGILGEKLGVPDLANLSYDISIRAHCEASDGHIHTDHWSKVATALIYLNQEWPASGGRLRFLRSRTDLEDYVAEVPPIAGTLLAFRRTGRSFHGHCKYVGPRRMIQISWLRSNPLFRAWHGPARYGTHLAKRSGFHPGE